jgi:arsenate reductase
MVTLYGIPNCDTMKKARAWLAGHTVDYVFHDYKKAGIDEKTLRSWIKQVGWETLLNRRGMMWRKVPQEVKDNIDETSAIQLMLETPSIIKRPVLDTGKQLAVGFKAENYEHIFNP